MKTNYASVSTDTPTAFLTKNKQRVKQYPNGIVYLKNGDEFEIELFNPTQTKVLAQIEMNGINISSTGIVIKPGQRVYLERYLDVAKKFLFETYEIESTDKEAQDAILRNGVISIKFSKEIVPMSGNYWTGNYNSGGTFTTYPPVYGSGLTHTINYIDTGTNFSCSVPSSNLSGIITSNSCTSLNVSSASATYTSAVPIMNMSAKIETGRVEKGSQSNQNFTTDYSNYGNVFATSVWKILPESVKHIEASDLTLYCASCGTKRKKQSHKFCPNCGTKF